MTGMNTGDREADPRWQKLAGKLALLYDELDPSAWGFRVAVACAVDDRSSGRLRTDEMVYTTCWSQEDGEHVTRRVIRGGTGLTMILEAATVDATVSPRHLEDLREPAARDQEPRHE